MDSTSRSYKIQNISQLFQCQEYHLRPRFQSLRRTEKIQGVRKEGVFYCGTKLPRKQNHANPSRWYRSHFPSRFMIHARHTIIHSPKVSPPHPSPNLRVLLLNISLSTPLLSLANIMLLLSLQLCVTVAGNACNDTLDGTGGTVGDA